MTFRSKNKLCGYNDCVGNAKRAIDL